MLRKFVCAAVVVVIGLSVVVAEEFQATITKIDGDKITFKKGRKGDQGDAVTLPVAKDAKITKGKYNADTKKVDAGDAIENGLKNDVFTSIGDKGLRARITTDDSGKNITAITTGGGFGGRGKKKGAVQ